MSLLLLIVLASGCGHTACCLKVPVQGTRGSVHYVVFGFGVISVLAPTEKTHVLVTRVHSVGATVSDQPGLRVGLGYLSSSLVAVGKDANNVIVEVHEPIGGPLTVHSQEVNTPQ